MKDRLLQAYLYDRNMSKKELSEKTGITMKRINEILRGSEIQQEEAERLSAVLKTTVDFWR